MKIHKVLALPPTLEDDAIYFVKNGIGADLYIVSNEGVATKVSSGVDYGLTLGESTTTAYQGDRGKYAYDHAQSPHVETKTDIGLGHVNNTSDLDKPISDDTQAALDTKTEPITVAEVAPVSPDEGDMWFDTVIGQLYTYYTDGDSGQWVSVNSSAFNSTLTTDQAEVLSHFSYDAVNEKIISDKAIETTLNSLFLGEQHKMSSGAENIFFTNLGNNTNFYPMWGGLKDQSLAENQGSEGYIPPSGRVYTDMFSTTLGGNPVPASSIGYSGGNFFGVSIAGLGITTVAAEEVNLDNVKLEYLLSIDGHPVYKQVLPQTGMLTADSTVEWYFDHPVEIHAGTTIFAEIRKVSRADDSDMGIFQVRVGDTNDPTTGIPRYQAIVHNRLFEDKDLELISPYQKYKTADFGLDDTGSTIFLRDLSLGTDNLLQPYAVNTLEAVATGTEIQIKIKDGAKIIIESLPVSGASVDGALVNSVLNQAVIQLNQVFTNTAGFSGTDTFVDGFALSGDDLTLTLNDGTSYTTDVTTLGVDTNNFVASGALSGSDLILTMGDATTVTIDASSLSIDTNDVVQSGTLNGDDLELTLSNSSVITIDVSALAVDTTLYVVSGVLSGTDLVLTMSDSSTVTVDASSLAIDSDTTVTGGEVSGTDILLDLSDSSTITIDASTLGGSGSSGNPVVSGSVVGSNLVLVLDDASEITIDASNMVNGSSGLATNSSWFISYGTNANDPVGTSTNDSTINQQLPFYFGQALERGSEFRWNFQNNGGANLILGIWDGAEVATAYNGGSATASNWGTSFNYAGGFVAGSNSTLTNTTNGSKYVVANGDSLGVRFLATGILTLIDHSGSGEVEIARTTNPLSVTSFNLQMHTWANGVLPNGIINNLDYMWDIVHDFDLSENGVLDGVEDHTVLQSTISIEKGEKIMFNLDEQGRNVNFGTSYVGGVSSALSTAEEELSNRFLYMTNEVVNFEFSGSSDWNVNANSTYYFDNGAGLVGYRKGSSSGTSGTGRVQGMFSLRFNDDGKLTIYSEDNNEKVATAKVDPTVGSSVRLCIGYTETTAYTAIPQISKQSLSQTSQPITIYAPTAADQTTSVTEGDVLNYQIVSSDNITNQFVEVDAPSWMSLNQSSGILSGTAPAWLDTAADTIVVNCKAGNAIGGTVDFTVTVTVTEAAYANSNSLSLDQSSNWLQGNPVNMNALDRATNGDGNAWTISMWVKPNSSTSNQTLLVYGAGDDYNGGAITLKQSGGTSLVLNYGTVYDNIILVVANSFVANTWQHVMVTFDGGTTGSVAADASDYYSRFDVYIDGVLKSNIGVASGGGYDGAISGANTSDNIYRIGRASNVHNNYYGGIINQVALWDSDETANLATIYNSGATQDLSLLASAPAHYYEIESSVTTITDTSGSADLTGYNFSSSDLVTDTP